jgi:hypothetical protein
VGCGPAPLARARTGDWTAGCDSRGSPVPRNRQGRLDQRRIEDWWNQFKGTPKPEWSVFQDRATVVAGALINGVTSESTSLVGRIIINLAYYEVGPVWLPPDAAGFANRIARAQG